MEGFFEQILGAGGIERSAPVLCSAEQMRQRCLIAGTEEMQGQRPCGGRRGAFAIPRCVCGVELPHLACVHGKQCHKRGMQRRIAAAFLAHEARVAKLAALCENGLRG